MGQSAQRQDMFSVPSGGIADFYMSEEDIAVIEQEEAQKAFGSEGVAAFDDVAKKMASYGRFGDDRIVHVESGEIVVPRALIEQSPELKESIFSHLREQGVEDPERYVVGSSANSLNPETGLPEFFLSKIAKKVGKVLKKAAPVGLPIALSMTPLGPIYGAALGSGIGTLMQGGDLEDALKNAVIAGGTGAVFSGVSGAAKPGGTFMGGIRADLANPGARFSQFGQGITGQQNFFRPFDASGVPVSTGDVSAAASQPMAGGAEYEGGLTAMNTASTTQPATDPSFFDRTADFIMPDKVTTTDALKQMGVNPANATATQLEIAKEMAAQQSPGFLRRYGPSIALAGLGAGALGFFDAPEVEEPEFVTGADLLAQDRDKYALPDEKIRYVDPYDPFVPQRPVVQVAEGGVIGSLNQIGQISDQVAAEVRDFVGGTQGGSMSSPGSSSGSIGILPQINENPFPKAPSLSAQDAYAQAVEEARRQRAGGFMGRVVLPGEMSFDQFSEGYNYRLNNPMQPLQATLFEEGGGVADVFPRRTGGIMPDEGIAGEDSVRAMLMPGEFVMTTDAVKGLGNGDNEQGIRKMYDMMRGLEAKGRAMA